MEANLSELSSLEQEAVNESNSGDRPRELARLVANNPDMPPDLLQQLSHSSNATTRKNVAANPNTPTEVLLKLGAEFPKQLLNNPVFSLLLLENPNLLKEISTTTLKSLLKQDEVPK